MGEKTLARRSRLDLAKMIAAIWVVAIHIGPFSEINQYLDYFLVYVFGRLAVPLFFTITGYFVLSYGDGSNKKIISFLKHIIFLYLFSIILYLPLTLHNGIGSITLINIIKVFIFDGTMYHLWYFPALIIGLIITYNLLNLLGAKITTIICFLLYIIGVFGDNYYGLIKEITIIKDVYDCIFYFSSYTRNGVFFAPLFLLLGYLIRYKNPEKKVNILLMVCSLFMLVMEGGIVELFALSKHGAMFFSLPVCLWTIFPLFLYGLKANTRFISDMATGVYIIHAWVIAIIFRIFRSTSLGLLGKYILVLIFSVLLSIICICIKNRRKIKDVIPRK